MSVEYFNDILQLYLLHRSYPIMVPHYNSLSSWEQPVLSQMSAEAVCVPTYTGSLSKDERGHEVSPHSGWLEDEEEDAEVVVDHVRALFALFGGLHVPRVGQIGAYGRPQRRATQPQDHRGGHESVPVQQRNATITFLKLANENTFFDWLSCWLPSWEEVSHWVGHVAGHASHNGPFAAQVFDHDGRQEHGGDDDGGVDDAQRDHAHPLLWVQTALHREQKHH